MRSTSNVKIFIIDDDFFTSNLLQHLLTHLGYQDIHIFGSGLSALEALQLRPDIVLLDYQLDHFNGLDFLKMIKQRHPEIFVVMVSGQKSMKTALDLLHAGALEYIAKGVQLEADLGHAMARIESLRLRIQCGVLQ